MANLIFEEAAAIERGGEVNLPVIVHVNVDMVHLYVSYDKHIDIVLMAHEWHELVEFVNARLEEHGEEDD